MLALRACWPFPSMPAAACCLEPSGMLFLAPWDKALMGLQTRIYTFSSGEQGTRVHGLTRVPQKVCAEMELREGVSQVNVFNQTWLP